MKKIILGVVIGISLVTNMVFAADNTGGQTTCKIEDNTVANQITPGAVFTAGSLKVKVNQYNSKTEKWELELNAPNFHSVIYLPTGSSQETVNICSQDVSIAIKYSDWLTVSVF